MERNTANRGFVNEEKRSLKWGKGNGENSKIYHVEEQIPYEKCYHYVYQKRPNKKRLHTETTLQVPPHNRECSARKCILPKKTPCAILENQVSHQSKKLNYQ